jgi:hypothetical protein
MNRNEFYTKKCEVLASLTRQFPDGTCWVISVKPLNNGPCAVSLDNGARVITEGTHRLCTK